MRRLRTIPDLRGHLATLRSEGGTIGLVPTMGALHEGHLALVRRLAAEVDTVVVSIFVNPTQFDRPEDLQAYPRDLAADEAALLALGPSAPAVLFTPATGEIYPQQPVIRVTVRGGLVAGLCGASRPGHFDGVATVVTKLLNIVQPDVAAFGRKDRQQLQIIRRLVADLDLPVTIRDVPTVREADGVALSSRNRRLEPPQREQARSLSRALAAAVDGMREARSANAEHIEVDRLHARAAAVLADASGVELDYLEVVDPQTMQPGQPSVPIDARLVVAVAANIGPVRLIDNVEIGDLDDEATLVEAVAGRQRWDADTAGSARTHPPADRRAPR